MPDLRVDYPYKVRPPLQPDPLHRKWWSFEPDETVSVTESVIGNASGGSDEEPVSARTFTLILSRCPTFGD